MSSSDVISQLRDTIEKSSFTTKLNITDNNILSNAFYTVKIHPDNNNPVYNFYIELLLNDSIVNNYSILIINNLFKNLFIRTNAIIYHENGLAVPTPIILRNVGSDLLRLDIRGTLTKRTLINLRFTTNIFNIDNNKINYNSKLEDNEVTDGFPCRSNIDGTIYDVLTVKKNKNKIFNFFQK